MTSTHGFLRIMHKLGTEGKTVSKVFRRMLDLELFIAAYTELAQNKGRLTSGIDGETIDGTTVEKLQELLEAIRNKSFCWTPVRRVYIPKSNKKKRPLGIPAWEDRIVQMVLKMVLESYYEPIFMDCSHGFRPQRGCHTALLSIRRQWQGTKWFIEGDIEGCFDNIPHQIILKLLEKRIKDNQLIRLIKEMLQAGYMEDWQYHATYSGTPQGGIISPLLANIVLHEFDEFICNTLIPEYTSGKHRKFTKKYHATAAKIRHYSAKGNKSQAAELRKKLRHMECSDPMDSDYKRLKYIRYADDFILSFIGPKSDAVEIKQRIQVWLYDELGLTLSEKKTFITNAKHGRARFLGYEIKVVAGDRMTTLKSPTGYMYKRRTLNGQIQLSVPKDVREAWVNKYCIKGKPTHRNTYLRYSDFEIVNAYGAEWRGLVNYYCLAANIHSLRRVEWTMLQSLTATLAGKHKTTRRKIRDQYDARFNGKKCLMCEVPNPHNPDKPLRAFMGGIPLRVQKVVFLNVDKLIWQPKYGRSELTQRLLADTCELCGSTEQVQVHHIRSIKKLKQRYRNKTLPKWVISMSGRNRNTLVVCGECHREIHAGQYDGKKVQSR
ncbi:reverse transcriptase domain-containing protein [Chloroflexota bacterium]